MEVVVIEITFVSLVTICEEVGSLARKHSILKVALIIGSIDPLVSAATQFLALVKVSRVLDSTIVPSLFSVSVLLIVDPLAVGGTPV